MDKNLKLDLAATLVLAFVMSAFGAMPARAAERTRDLSIGTVTNVRCRGRRLDMNLKNAQGTMHLFTANYLKLDLTAENFKVKGKLNPCKEINGYKATAVFYDVPRRPNEGELISVRLSKPESQ